MKFGAVPAPRLEIVRRTLRCGALLLISPRPGAPVTAIHAHLRGGHRLDPAGREGVAFLTGALAPEGVRGASESEIADLLEPAGGSLTGDSAGISGAIAGEHWKLLLDLAARMLTEPTYPKERFERQRQRLLDRLVVDARDPRIQGGRLFRRLVYGPHHLGRGEHGSPESVARLDRRDLAAFHRSHWVAGRAVIAVCGDVDPDAVHRHLDRLLAKWPKGRDIEGVRAEFPPLERRVGAFRAERQQVHLYLGHLGVRRADPDYPALVVMDHVLGTGPGFTSRIPRRLRDEQGLAYSVHASIHSSAGLLPGMFTAYIGTSPEHLERSVAGLVEEIRRIREQPVEDHELELARQYLLGSFALGFERSSRRAAYAVYAERQGLPDDHLEALPKAFAKVSAEDVLRAAAKHLHPEALCLAGAGPVEQRRLNLALEGALGVAGKGQRKKAGKVARAKTAKASRRRGAPASVKPRAARGRGER